MKPCRLNRVKSLSSNFESVNSLQKISQLTIAPGTIGIFLRCYCSMILRCLFISLSNCEIEIKHSAGNAQMARKAAVNVENIDAAWPQLGGEEENPYFGEKWYLVALPQPLEWLFTWSTWEFFEPVLQQSIHRYSFPLIGRTLNEGSVGFADGGIQLDVSRLLAAAFTVLPKIWKYRYISNNI